MVKMPRRGVEFAS